jgi:hypothetical protein
MLISFKEESFQKAKEAMTIRKEDKLINISDITDSITEYILTNYQALILQIESGKMKRSELNTVIEEYIKSQEIILDNMDSYKSVVTAVYDYIFGYRFIHPYIDRFIFPYSFEYFNIC